MALLRTEGWQLGLGLLIATGLGLLLNILPWALCAFLLGYLLRLARQLQRLQIWLQQHNEQDPPEATGLWGEIFDQLYHRQKRQQRAQGRLQTVINRVQDSSEALRDGVITLDSEGNLEWWNSAAEKMLGLRAAEDRGQPITHLLRDPRFIEYFEMRRYQEPLILPSPILDGIQLEFQITLYGEDNRLIMLRDVTRLKRLEQMRQDFVANVSHELRTPLTVLSGYLETFSDYSQDLPPRWQRGLELMRQQSVRMEHLVNDLLTLSRLETSDFEQEQDPIDVHRLLEAIRHDAQALSGDKQHMISIEADSNVKLYGSEKELRSAFSNLVFNAIKYTPAGTEIRLRWRHERSGAQLAVIDGGEGIEPSHLPRLTERFYRVDKGRSASTGGTGLGLAIVKHVLLRHQGRLDIHSELGVGSEFICHFPPARLALDPAAAHPPHPSKDFRPQHRLKSS
ncbi:phosphate regulon sensor histidine kinase PhoR [Terasakiispira papahanaumokuakeensis]|uniref:Phosphate regulon sensor protein PhoR n=1 Tax=Terasakiispira papahanaumokuakeensis TaxID=197479 RepID=A0A1E2VEY0_9GAMM|nr:phosphate regulon sensor histidine kinase PhoR [Terasakiispira papahanaumokuakeensis]